MSRAIFGFFACFVSINAFAVELRDATNQQILDELSFRLRSGGQVEQLLTTFTCDSDGDMVIRIIPTNGNPEKTVRIANSAQSCEAQIVDLERTFSSISRPTILSVCDLLGELRKFSVFPKGTITPAGVSKTSSFQVCLQQSKIFNQSNGNF